MRNIIEVNGIRLYAYHGCLTEEGKVGGHYVVDVSMSTDFREASETDDLTKTIDYVTVNRIVKEEMAIRSKLIEHVGKRIMDRLKEELPTIYTARVKIIKNTPPINGDVKNVAIIIEEEFPIQQKPIGFGNR